MDKKQLLVVSGNQKFIKGFKTQPGFPFEITSVKNIHAGYTMALGFLPDAILIDYTSMDPEGTRNIQNFKSTHFLNKTNLFLCISGQQREEVENRFGDSVDYIVSDSMSTVMMCAYIEEAISRKKCLTNYWKDSFMGLFNLMKQPVILLENEKIIAINDAFKKYFFVANAGEIHLTDFVDCKNKFQVVETVRNFARGKHMKASTTTSLLLMNSKIREAKITFSKLDRNISGQMILMIDFEERDSLLNEEIGTASRETEKFFADNNTASSSAFTKREKEIMELLCKGYKTKEISETLCISSKTIEKHRANIIKRTNSDTILESVVYAINHKLIEV